MRFPTRLPAVSRDFQDRQLIQTVDKTLCKNMREAARSGRFVSREEVARRVGIAVQISRPSVRRSELQRNPLDVFLVRQRQQHEVLLLETESADCRGLLRVDPETLSCFFRGCRDIAIIEVWRFGRAEPLGHDVDVADLNHGST